MRIFGPILPIVFVSSVPDACKLIPKIHEKPLGLHILTEDPAELEYVVKNTTSGGASLNDVMTQIAISILPFGGVGPSGMASYHGKASIDTFSHRKSVVHIPKEAEDGFEWRCPSGDQVGKFNFYKTNLEAKL
jgi:acyl-CoA reductase-like NAD-dependent aldehyde dehydrogenase